MDIKHFTAADGATVGVRAWTTYEPFNDPARDGEMGLATFFHRPVALPNPEAPGSWLALVEIAQTDEYLDWDNANQVPEAAWQRSEPLEGSFSSAKEARFAALKEVQDRHTKGQDDLMWKIDPEEAMAREDQNKEFDAQIQYPSFSRGRLSFDEDLGRDTAGATVIDPCGFFYDTAVDENGWPCDDCELLRREAVDQGTAIYFEAGGSIPYETGAARPDAETMAKGLRQRQGNLVRYALDNKIGLIDALRDGLISGEMKLQDPVAMVILDARVRSEIAPEAPDLTSLGQDLATGLDVLRTSLGEDAALSGLDAREEMITLSAVRRLSPRSPEAHAQVAAEIFDTMGAARRYGLEPTSSAQVRLAKHALAAVAQSQTTAERHQDGPRIKDEPQLE